MKLLDYIEKFLDVAIVLVFITMVTATSAQVVSRYLFTPISWTEELARYSYIWLVYLGFGVLQKRKEHIKLDLLNKYITKNLSMIFDLIIDILSIVTFVIILIGSYKLLTSVISRSPCTVLPFSMGYIYIVLPIGFGITTIFSAANFYNNLKEFLKTFI